MQPLEFDDAKLLWKMFYAQIIPSEHLELHRLLLEHRDQIYAHTDATTFELPDYGPANQVRVLRLPTEMKLFGTEFHARYPLLPPVILLCRTLQEKAEYHVDKLLERYGKRVPKRCGEYAINICDQSGSFFVAEKPLVWKRMWSMNPQARPERLFRYFPPERTNFFAEKTLWFSALKDFNDPFDALPRFDSMLESQIEQGIKKQFAFLPPQVNCDWATFNKELNRNTSAYIAAMSLDVAEQYRELVSKDYRLVCFSETLDNLLMWGHYARSHDTRGHTGFVVEFDPKHQIFATEEFAKVDYPETNERTKVEDRDQGKDELWKILFRKSREWGYEKEWRLVKLASSLEKQQYLKFPTDLILAVYFGWQMLPSDRDKLVESLKSPDWKEVTQFVMCPDPAKYAVKPVPLEEWLNRRNEYDDYRIALEKEIQSRTQVHA